MMEEKIAGFGGLRFVGALLIASALVCSPSAALELGNTDVAITLDSTYVSKYIWHGFDVLPDDDSAQQSFINVDWQGLSVGVWSSFALQNGHEPTDELDYYAYYAYTVAEESRYAADLLAGYVYFDFPNSDSKAGADGVADQQELSLEIRMINLLPALGPGRPVPFYGAYYEFPGKDSNGSEIPRAWFHLFGLGYDVPLADLGERFSDQTLSLSWDITFNDGVYGADHDWSHTTFAAATTFAAGPVGITPAVNYQISFEDTVNDENEFYASLGVSYSF